MCLVDFEVKGSRSYCINYWKWFLTHNCFPFTPIIMKLHMQTPHESRMCPIDFEVKRSRSQWRFWYLEKMSPRGVFVPLGQPRSSFTWDLCFNSKFYKFACEKPSNFLLQDILYSSFSCWSKEMEGGHSTIWASCQKCKWCLEGL